MIAPVAIDTSPAAARRFVKGLGLASFETFVDPDASLTTAPGAAFHIFGMPMSFVLDRRGAIAGYIVGAADWRSSDALNLLRHYGRN